MLASRSGASLYLGVCLRRRGPLRFDVHLSRIPGPAVGAGPVNALDHALRKALEKFYPQLREVKLLDYKVRVLSADKGTESKVRVLIESGDHKDKWGTVGVSENIMEASWQALADSIEYKLLLADR